MHLNDYPAAIALAAQALADLEARITTLKLEAERCECEVELDVAFDGSLKNEQQRKVRKAQMLNERQLYTDIQQNLVELDRERAIAQGTLERLRNELSILRDAAGREPVQVINPPQGDAHYLVLTVKPDAGEWGRFSIHDPITNSIPNLAKLVADQMAAAPGEYLVEVNLAVTLLSKTVHQAEGVAA